MRSNWQITQARSNYHFDTRAWDSRYDGVTVLGRLQANWTAEVADAVARAQPVTWRTRGQPGEALQRSSLEHDQEDYDLETQGYGADHVVTDLTYDLHPRFQDIANQFALERSMARVHVQRPGQTWNLHIDKLEKWMPADPRRVVRYFVALTDWQQGHFWSYGNYQYWGWRAGDVTTFDWYNVPHATANAGHVPRVTLQITGIPTADTAEFLHRLRQQI